MSDLQCAATILLVAEDGDPDAVGLAAGALRSRRVSALYASAGDGAQTAARAAGAELGLVARVLEGVQEYQPDLESDDAVVSRMRSALEGVADLHRGETALVVSHPRAIATAVPALITGGGAGSLASATADGVVELRVDADGWVLEAR